MATLTVFGDAADAAVGSSSATYLNARAGENLAAGLDSEINLYYDAPLGQREFGGEYRIDEGFISFDTSPLTSSAIVSAAELSLFDASDATFDNAYTIQARIKDWGAAVTTADWVAGASLSGLTLVATLASAARSVNAYNAFADVAFPANVNKTGTTRLILHSSRTEAGNAPGAGQTETWLFYAADQTGTDNDPKLVITYTLPASGGASDPGRRFFTNPPQQRGPRGFRSQDLSPGAAAVSGRYGLVFGDPTSGHVSSDGGMVTRQP